MVTKISAAICSKTQSITSRSRDDIAPVSNLNIVSCKWVTTGFSKLMRKVNKSKSFLTNSYASLSSHLHRFREPNQFLSLPHSFLAFGLINPLIDVIRRSYYGFPLSSETSSAWHSDSLWVLYNVGHVIYCVYWFLCRSDLLFPSVLTSMMPLNSPSCVESIQLESAFIFV